MPLADALRATGFSKSEIARRLGVTRACVTNWTWRGQIPEAHVDRLVRLSRGRIQHRDLRPDLYPERRGART